MPRRRAVSHKDFAEQVNAFHPEAKQNGNQVTTRRDQDVWDPRKHKTESRSVIQVRDVRIVITYQDEVVRCGINQVPYQSFLATGFTVDDLQQLSKYLTEVRFLMERINK